MSWYDPTSWDSSTWDTLGTLAGGGLGFALGGPLGAALGAGAGGLLSGSLTGGAQAPNVGGPNPYQGDWNGLIQMLRQRAQSGQQAQMDYIANSDKLMGEAQQVSRGGSPGGALAGARAIEDIGQNQAFGAARAGAAERAGATDALGGALGGASADWMGPQSLDLQKWAIQNGLDMSKLQALAGLLGAGASLVPRGGQGGGGFGGAPNGLLQDSILNPAMWS